MLPAEFGLFLADSDEKDSCLKYQWSEEFVKMETILLFQTKQARNSKLKLSKPFEINNMRWGFALSRHSDILNLKTNPSVFHNRITCSWTRLWAITIEVQRVGQLCSNAWGLNLNAAFRVAVKYYVADFSVKERGYHQFRLAFLGRMVFR